MSISVSNVSLFSLVAPVVSRPTSTVTGVTPGSTPPTSPANQGAQSSPPATDDTGTYSPQTAAANLAQQAGNTVAVTPAPPATTPAQSTPPAPPSPGPDASNGSSQPTETTGSTSAANSAPTAPPPASGDGNTQPQQSNSANSSLVESSSTAPAMSTSNNNPASSTSTDFSETTPATFADATPSAADVDRDRARAQQVSAQLALQSLLSPSKSGAMTVADVLDQTQKSFADLQSKTTSEKPDPTSKSADKGSTASSAPIPNLSRIHEAYGLVDQPTQAAA